MSAEISNYAQQVQSIVQDASNLMVKQVQTQSDTEIAALDEKFRKGEVGEQEYADKKKAIQKKAAQEQYKINMFAWTASLLTATANIAEGVTKAIAQDGLAGVITGALVSAAGGVQLASIIASKPQPPAFARGGVVPGNSYAGDNVIARVNSGEMVLTRAQQRALFDMANSGRGYTTPTIEINNNAANIVNAQPVIDRDKIAIMIDAHINDSMRKGVYNQSMTMAQQSANGDFYGI